MSCIVAIFIVVTMVGCLAVESPKGSDLRSGREELVAGAARPEPMKFAQEGARRLHTNVPSSMDFRTNMRTENAPTIIAQNEHPEFYDALEEFIALEPQIEAMIGKPFECNEEQLEILKYQKSLTDQMEQSDADLAEEVDLTGLVIWVYTELYRRCSEIVTAQILNYKSTGNSNKQTNWKKLYSEMRILNKYINKDKGSSLVFSAEQSCHILEMDPSTELSYPTGLYGQEKNIVPKQTTLKAFVAEHCGEIDKEEPLRKIFQWARKLALDEYSFNSNAREDSNHYPDVLAHYLVCERALENWGSFGPSRLSFNR